MNRISRFLLLSLLLLSTPVLNPAYADNWMITVHALNLNTNPEGPNLYDYFEIGEHVDAEEGFDSFDFPKPNPFTSPFILAYIRHTTWGVNNGRYHRDIRSTTIAQKTWNIEVIRQSPYSNNYSLTWDIPPEVPGYYNLRLTHGSVIIDMRSQNSYSYSAAGTAYFQIQTVPQYGIPYITDQIDTLHFSDNLEQVINLDEHFGILDSSILYSLENNPHIVQEIILEEGTPYWHFYPAPGWTGTTTAIINAVGTSGNCTMEITIIRDETNSPPYYTGSEETVVMTQNLPSIIDLHNTVHDDDLDDVTVTVLSGIYIEAEYDSLANLINLVPHPSFKGSDSITLILDDSVNDPVEIALDIEVLPSEPQAVQNIETSFIVLDEPIGRNQHDVRTVTYFSLRWSEVTVDVNNSPINGVIYKVLIWNDPDNLFDDSEAQELITHEPDLMIEAGSEMMFFKIIAVNP